VENTFCVIDVGTNNVLLLIASVNDHLNIIKRSSQISALGKDMKDDILNIEAINRTKLILTNFIETAHEFTENIIVVGTSCSRDAKNISVLSNWLKDKYQINYHIISGNEEAHFNGLANINEFRNNRNIILFDAGGGSTEFIWMKNGKIIQTQSIDLGIRRLQNLFGSDYQKKYKEAKKLLNTLPSSPFEDSILVGIGGTATSLSAMKFQLEKYDPQVVHKSKIAVSELKNILSKLSGKTENQIAELIPFEPKRADLIETGTMIVAEILDYFGVEEFFVSDRGIQFGILVQNRNDLYKMLSKG
jgi:exopolyphosphatase / guanosine-5'-triphosphate,3'-diphosphate pyrophosphatase